MVLKERDIKLNIQCNLFKVSMSLKNNLFGGKLLTVLTDKHETTAAGNSILTPFIMIV